ncbi:hypothetical protein [Streptomonospora alba]|uniref:hypothetical protein n=1 Tax=Streptomonospora alba TaxID=183763 RepID=UPI00069B129C|nr:hypothetical protein [Streptomonospora alba]
MTDEEKENGGGRKRVELSASQLIGGGVATMAAATAASFIGVYGTVIGAAIMSVISTAGTTLVTHWMQRGGDRARGLAARGTARRRYAGEASARDSPAGSGPGAADGDTPPAAAGQEAPADAEGGDSRAAETQALSLGASGSTQDTAGEGPKGRREPGRAWRWPSWRTLAVPAALVFVGVMAVVLVFELFTGQSLSDTVHGREGSSAPTVFGGGSADGQEGSDPAPGPTPTAREEDGTPAAPTGGVEEQQEQWEQREQRDQPGQEPAEPGGGDGGQTGEETSAPEEDTGETEEQAPPSP